MKIKTVAIDSATNSLSIGQAERKPLSLTTVRQADILIVWLIMTAANLFSHHLIPLDETRYASVAWEMWQGHNFLLPHLNGLAYHHKPPLLFWLYSLGWRIFGVNEIWVLLVSPVCGLISLYATRYLAKLLWPDTPAVGRLAPWLLFGSVLWGAFLNSAMFDTLLSTCVLLALVGLVKAGRNFSLKAWVLFGLGGGLGLLAKGPVVFVHILPAFLLGFAWSETAKTDLKRWYLYGFAAIVGAVALALLWAIPAIASAGDGYGFELLWQQTAGRISNSFAHQRPIWWYLMLAPILLFPWFFWPRVWRSFFQRESGRDSAFRLCLIWFVSGFVAFSFISGKQVHYLIPLMPALALLLSRLLASTTDEVRAGDYLPFLLLMLFGLFLLILPHIDGVSLYHWLKSRKLWWALAILLTSLGGMTILFTSRSISSYPLSMTVILVLIVSLPGFFESTGNAFYLQQAARLLDQYRKAGEPIAWAGKYDGQFQFLLRMNEPLEVIEKSAASPWLATHRNGHVISIESPEALDSSARCNDYRQYYREDTFCVHS